MKGLTPGVKVKLPWTKRGGLAGGVEIIDAREAKQPFMVRT